MFSHQTRACQRFLSTLTYVDSRLTLESARKPNFDPTIEIGWNQSYYEYY